MPPYNDKLLAVIKNRAEELRSNKIDLFEIFTRAVNKAKREVVHGSDPEGFTDLTVAYFITTASEEGASEQDIRSFVETLKVEASE